MNKYDIDFRFPTYPDCYRQRIWTLLRKSQNPMRMLDIERICGTEHHQNAKHYVNALCRMGYVAVVGHVAASEQGGHYALYRLIKDTGPLYPVERKVGHIYFDQNTGKVWSDTYTDEEMLAVMRKAAKRAQSKTIIKRKHPGPAGKEHSGGMTNE